MNISTRKAVLIGSAVATMVVAGIVSSDLGLQTMLTKASNNILSSRTIQWSAVLGVAITILYLLVNKDALKRKVIQYGEVGFVVKNGNPRRYRWGERKGRLVVRRAGQGKNVIPKLRDVVVITWLLDVFTTEDLETMYDNRRLGYSLSIEYTLPEPVAASDLEKLLVVAFGFSDPSRYDGNESTFRVHLKNRVIEAIPKVLAECPMDTNGLPELDPGKVDWLSKVELREGITLATLRVSVLNPRFTALVELQ